MWFFAKFFCISNAVELAAFDLIMVRMHPGQCSKSRMLLLLRLANITNNVCFVFAISAPLQHRQITSQPIPYVARNGQGYT